MPGAAGAAPATRMAGFQPEGGPRTKKFYPTGVRYGEEKAPPQEEPPQAPVPGPVPGPVPASFPLPGPEPASQQNEYYQEAYQPQPQEQFQQGRSVFHAPRARDHRMLNLFLTFVIVVLAIVLIYAAMQRVGFNQASNTALVSAGNLGSNYTGDALIVRNETLYTQEGVSQIDYSAEEGVLVSRGSPVCTVYTSGFNQKEWTTLANYRSQIKTYQLSLLSSANIDADTRLKSLNSETLARALETQALVQGAGGNLLNQEKLLSTAISERSYYLKQKYAEDQKLSRLYEEESAQLGRIETWTRPFLAGDTGLISFYSDGFERVLNTGSYSDYTPAEVRNMYNGKLPAASALGRNEVAVYRLVKEGSYVVLMLCDETQWNPVIGSSYGLLIESFENTRVSATVDSITRSGGELLVRLVVQGSVSPVLYIRSCHVQLSESIYSLTVPSRALTDSNGQVGVVVVQADGNYFLPVNVIDQNGTEAHIVPLLDNILRPGSVVLLF